MGDDALETPATEAPAAELSGAEVSATSGSATAWSSAAFQFSTSPGSPPDWRLDHLVAAEVVAPLLEQFGPEIARWRVHRRAAPDATGHQFTLFAYTQPEVAQALFDGVSATPVVDQLAREGHLRRLVLLEGGPEGRPNIEDTSDRNWSPELARAWPSFIEGVSGAWVALVVAHTPVATVAEETLDEKLVRYGAGAEAVGAVWREEGSHAFVHHISAVFGYGPLLVRF